MSEKILNALMQLFAIISRPESKLSDRRTVVESFLIRQLNRELAPKYLKVFDDYYSEHQEKQKEKDKITRRISSISVRVLKICTDVNEELTQQQKVIVLFQLLEFVKSDGNEVSHQEMEFINTVASIFNFPADEYEDIKQFVLTNFEHFPESEHVLLIDNRKDFQHPAVKHSLVEGMEGQIRILYLPSSNIYLLRYVGEKEIYLNGQLLQHDKVHVFTTGSSIRNPQIKPIYYSDVVSSFHRDLMKEKIVFEADRIEYHFSGGKIGLHEMSFSEESGRLVGIMGASGAGKSTLLNVLNGTASPTSGSVRINGYDIHKEKEKLKGLIGYVSQDDLLIEELTVFQNLYYNAKLCFDNYTEKELVETVNRTLENLGLYEIKDIQVGSPLNKKISGGQRKRLNIALELIREPSVLFLDEPTSGLSSRDSVNIMDLLKELSLKGKLVFVVIHQPSSEIFKMFDRLLILDTGGYLIYNGDPIDSIIYFKERVHHANWNESECHACGNVNPEQIFNIVELAVLDEYGKQTRTRKISPQEWYSYYKEYSSETNQKKQAGNTLPKISFKTPNRFRQFLIFAKRDILSKLANTQYLVINFLEAPVLALIMAYIIKYYNVNVTNQYGYTLFGNSNLPVYLFMSVIVAIFVGLTVSAEEIIKDRKILKREAFLDLSWSSYLLSKVGVQFGLSAIQALTFVLVGNSIMEIKGMYWQYWLVLFSIWTSSNMMGLMISDSFKTVVTIYILIPFLVIPQIILSGVLVKYEKLNPAISSPTSIPFYGELMTARWGYEALAVYQFKENKYDRQFYQWNKIMSMADFRKNYWINHLNRKLDEIESNIDHPESKQKVENDLQLLRNEIGKENQRNRQVAFAFIDSLVPGHVTPRIMEEARSYLRLLNTYYIRLSNKANEEKDKLISSLQRTPEMKESFQWLKRRHANEALEEFVTNKNETDRILEYKNHLYQKINPIYLDPESRFIKAHFYAPRKMVFGRYIDTIWVNIGVIWFMTIILYLMLYFRLLKKLLDSIENLSLRFSQAE
ncbi:MAG: ATP-binding cassette domain-containing protein [Bacteroidales bacterium]|nr:ATP-binding cassette domain-containing protein [Bacteroidales bacterium]